eukprot:g144.t1
MLGGSYAEGGSTSSSGPASSTDRGSADDPAASSSTGLFARAKTAIRTRLEAQGLTKGDVAKIGGLFLAAKYATYGSFLFVGIRYRPLLSWIQRQQKADWATRNPFVQERSRWFRERRGAFQRSQTYGEFRNQWRKIRSRLRGRREQMQKEISKRATEQANEHGRSGSLYLNLKWLMEKYADLAQALSKQAEGSALVRGTCCTRIGFGAEMAEILETRQTEYWWNQKSYLLTWSAWKQEKKQKAEVYLPRLAPSGLEMGFATQQQN